MASELIINVTFSETRIAFLENGVLTEFFQERKNDKSIVGNIYKGKVVRILPGMDAAFVDIGLEKSAFLYVGDIVVDSMMYEEFEEIVGTPVESSERIEGVIEEGQEIIVQVSREPIGQKGTRVTSRITLPGRLLVLMSASEHIGVSTEDRGRGRAQEARRHTEGDMPQGLRPHREDRVRGKEGGRADGRPRFPPPYVGEHPGIRRAKRAPLPYCTRT